MKKRYTREDLTEKQVQWIDRFVELGGTRSAATAAVKMVYGYDGNAASVQAGRMLKNQKIQDELIDECVATFAAGAILATDKLIDILENGMWFGQPVKPNDGLKAISMMMERGIGPIAQLHEHNHNHQVDSLTTKELRSAIAGELRKLPDAERAIVLKQLGGGDVIDVDAVEVDPEAPWGRKNDGKPKQKPGPEKQQKRVLPGPEAYKPAAPNPVKDRIARIKARKLKEKREAAHVGGK